MATKEIQRCDICGIERDTSDLHGEVTWHIRQKIMYRLFWWRGRHKESDFDKDYDICEKCMHTIRELRDKQEGK